MSRTSTDQIAALLRASTDQGMPLTFRSGGSSLSGQASTAGVLVDTRRNFRDIEVLDDGLRVRVQPGATVRAINARLSPHKRKVGPDPASEAACTIGGVVANNSSGLLRLRERVRANPTSMATIGTLYSIKNTMGYGLNSLVDHHSAIDILLHLAIGNDGTLKAEHGTGRIMAPFVRRQYGDELFEVMREIERSVDPQGLLNPGVLLNDDPDSHVSNLKVTPTIEKEVDRCVECGYCEPVCPSKDLTLTPRLRIVLRREMADATAGGDLVRRLRSERHNGIEQAAWEIASQHWHGTTRLGGFVMSTLKKLPAPLVTGGAAIVRKVIGPDTVPLWTKDLPKDGVPRTAFAPCIGTMFGPAAGAPGVTSAFLSLCERAGVSIVVRDGIASICCGTPWKSKGFSDGWEEMRERLLPALWAASDHGRIPVVCDAASCTEGIEKLIGFSDDRFPGLRIVDTVEFVDERTLATRAVTAPIGSLALHPTCSSTLLGTNDASPGSPGPLPPRSSCPMTGDAAPSPGTGGCCTRN